MRLTDHLLHSGMPPLNVVVGPGLMLIEVVPVNGWKVPINPSIDKVAVKYRRPPRISAIQIVAQLDFKPYLASCPESSNTSQHAGVHISL